MAGQRNSYGKRPHSSSDHSDSGDRKRRNGGEDRESFVINDDDAVYRYLCPANKIGSVIGRGGDIIKQLRADTRSKIRIGETMPGCSERVVTIYSMSDETNHFDEMDTTVCPAQDALFRIHERVIGDDIYPEREDEQSQNSTARLLVPSDQIGCIIGKGGQIVQGIRSDTGAQIRILKDNHLPACALSSDELVQVSGEPQLVKKALYEITSRLRDNPSRSQHLLVSSGPPNAYPSGGLGPTGSGPIMGFAPIVSPYAGYRRESADWKRSSYPSRDDRSSREFSIRFVCPTENIGGVIGKGGAIINQIRQETHANVKVDSEASEEDNCLILVSSKEYFDEHVSPTIEAARRLQPRCSEKVERDSGVVSFTTRVLVPTSRIGCLIGKGGSIISEMRKATRANIRITSKDNLPKVAEEDDELVLISGDLDVCETALMSILGRLRANVFEKEGSLVMPVPYVPMPADDVMGYDDRDSKRHGRGYSGGYGGSHHDLRPSDPYSSYSSLQSGGSGGSYGIYGGYSSGRSSGSGYSTHAAGSRRKPYGY